MRIMMLSWEFPPQNVGGLSQHVYELSRALVKEGVHVDVITSGGEKIPERETMEGIGVWRVNTFQGGSGRDFIDWVQRLNFALLEKGALLSSQKNKYDLIHAHDWLATYAARSLKYIYTTPLLATIHATEFGRNNGLHNDEQRNISELEWWLTYEAWKVVCCSRYMKDELQNVFQLPEEKIEIIPNGIRPEAYQPSDQASIMETLPVDPHEKIIFYIGRLVKEKGVQVLLDAAPAILERFPNARFVIAGKGPFEESLQAQARNLGLEDKVHFLGYVNDQARNSLYDSASVAVFASLYEPFGIVALEAMASGTPVVVSSVGGLDEIIQHEKDGLKVYPGDPNSLAEQICRLLENEDWAASLAEKGYEKAVSNYSWKKIAQRTAKVYSDIILSPENTKWKDSVKKKRLWEEVTITKGGEEEAEIPYLV
ncbi:MAG: glycosyltransferase family 4 protein [Bacillota bacterium]|nr:glycosyltransferase family 4 protein [Bacillota bacterium]